jgi:ribosomal protein L37AE/L43A
MIGGTQDEVNEIMAGMDRAMNEWVQHIEKIAPRCHFTPMQLETLDDESWWECRHCGHTKDGRSATPESGDQGASDE